MARIHTHYDNLKVARNAPPEVIRAAYKTLSQKYHPDRHPGSQEAIRIIQIINLAYEVLSDPVKRREHDAWIERTEKEEQKSPENSASGRGHPSSEPALRRKSAPSRHRHGRSRHRGPLDRMRSMWEQFARLFGKRC